MQYLHSHISGKSEELDMHRHNQIHMGVKRVVFGFLRFCRDASHLDVSLEILAVLQTSGVRFALLLSSRLRVA